MDILLKNKIRRYFEDAIKADRTIDETFRLSLIKHERSSIFIDNMVDQLTKAAEICMQRRGVIIKDKTIRETVYSMAEVFVNSVRIESESRIESILSKIKKEAEAQKIKDMDATLAGNPQGDYVELIQGVRVGTKRRTEV